MRRRNHSDILTFPLKPRIACIAFTLSTKHLNKTGGPAQEWRQTSLWALALLAEDVLRFARFFEGKSWQPIGSFIRVGRWSWVEFLLSSFWTFDHQESSDFRWQVILQVIYLVCCDHGTQLSLQIYIAFFTRNLPFTVVGRSACASKQWVIFGSESFPFFCSHAWDRSHVPNIS